MVKLVHTNTSCLTLNHYELSLATFSSLFLSPCALFTFLPVQIFTFFSSLLFLPTFTVTCTIFPLSLAFSLSMQLSSLSPCILFSHSHTLCYFSSHGSLSGMKTASLSSDSNRSSICTVEESAAVTCTSSKEMSSSGGVTSNGNTCVGRTSFPFIARAQARVDCAPCPYEKDALAFKVSVWRSDFFLSPLFPSAAK